MTKTRRPSANGARVLSSGDVRYLFALVLSLLGLLGCGDDPAERAAGGAGDGGSGGAGGSEAGARLPCPPGALPVGDACEAPGVPADGCGVGFAHDGVDACEAILPATACGSGEFALPGETMCHGVGSCGAGQWGDIPVEASTVYVDASFGAMGDGSATAPFASVQAGVDAASDGAIVAIAAGSYVENVWVDHPVRLWGVCASDVQIVATSGVAVSLAGNADGSALVGLGLSSGGDALQIVDASSVLLDALWIHDAGGIGIALLGSSAAAGLRLEGSLIENVSGYGISAYDGDVELIDSAIRDVAPDGAANWGVGLIAFTPVQQDKRSVSLERVHIERTRSFGVVVQRAVDTVIADTLIRDVLPSASLGGDGMGIWQRWSASDGARPSLALTASVIERTHATAIGIYGGDATIERTTVRDVAQDDLPGGWGAGIRFFDLGEGTNTPPAGSVRQSTVDRAHRVGVELWAAVAELSSVVVREPQPKLDGAHGFGVIAYVHDLTLEPSDLIMRGSVVDRAHQGGIIVAGSTGLIEDCAVVDTQPKAADDAFGVGISILTELKTALPASAAIHRTVVDGAYGGGVVVGGGDLTLEDVTVRNIARQVNVDDFGDGIGASATLLLIPGILPTTMQVTRATVEGVPRAGISSFGALISVGQSLLDCNGIDLDGENLDGATFGFEDGGGNDCGCGQARVDCKVLTSNIAPPLGL
jgi:hypothetical protein